MKKNLYVARTADSFEDTFKVFYNKEDATEAAKDMFYHLTARERGENTVTVETYLVTVEENDERTAEQLYSDLLDEESPEVLNIPDYDEITEIERDPELWYAWHTDPEVGEGDDDGTYDRDEAISRLREMLPEYPRAYITIWADDTCEGYIRAEDL